MRWLGHIELDVQANHAGEIVSRAWRWVGGPIAQIRTESLGMGLPEVQHVGKNCLQVGPFAVRIVGRSGASLLPDDALYVMRDGLTARIVARLWRVYAHLRAWYWRVLIWLKLHGYMATREGESISWRHIRLRRRPWPLRPIVSAGRTLEILALPDEDE